jgi:hypothetical protein
VDIGVATVLHHATGSARAARPTFRVSLAQQPGRQVKRERGLADPVRTRQQDRVRRLATDYRRDGV